MVEGGEKERKKGGIKMLQWQVEFRFRVEWQWWSNMIWIRIKKEKKRPKHKKKKNSIQYFIPTILHLRQKHYRPFRCPSQRHHRFFFLIIHFHKFATLYNKNPFFFFCLKKKTPNVRHKHALLLLTTLFIYTPPRNGATHKC